jgi:hypothetical protein
MNVVGCACEGFFELPNMLDEGRAPWPQRHGINEQKLRVIAAIDEMCAECRCAAEIMAFEQERAPGIAEPNAGGTIGFATSPDLLTWTLQPPVYRGGMFGQMEVPQVFQYRGKWYCLFCTAAEHWSEAYKAFNPQSPVTGSHYLIADDPRGPWASVSLSARNYYGLGRYEVTSPAGEIFVPPTGR